MNIEPRTDQHRVIANRIQAEFAKTYGWLSYDAEVEQVYTGEFRPDIVVGLRDDAPGLWLAAHLPRPTLHVFSWMKLPEPPDAAEWDKTGTQSLAWAMAHRVFESLLLEIYSHEQGTDDAQVGTETAQQDRP